MKPAQSRKIDTRAAALAIIATLTVIQAVICAATGEAVQAANWFGAGFLALGILTLRACLIDIRKGI